MFRKQVSLSINLPVAVHRRLMRDPRVREGMATGHRFRDQAITKVIEDGIDAQEFPRDLDRAVEEVDKMIRLHLETTPSGSAPVEGLTPGLSLNLARHLACLLDDIGRDFKGEEQ